MPIRTVVYLHGFLSSPASAKAQAFARAAEKLGLTCRIPNLNVADPERLNRVLGQATDDLACGQWGLVGSSLGGFFAAHLASIRPVRAVLVNAAVRPWDYAEPYRAKMLTAADGTKLAVTDEWLAALKAMRIRPLAAPKEALVMVTTGDEVLNWHESLAAFPESPAWIVPGSDHAVSDISRYIDALFTFLLQGVAPQGAATSGR